MTETCQHCGVRLRTKHRRSAPVARCHDCTAEDGTAKDPDDSEQADEDSDKQSDEDTCEPTSALVEKTPNGWRPASST